MRAIESLVATSGESGVREVVLCKVVMPDLIPDTPENIARACMMGSPEEEWDYPKPGKHRWRICFVWRDGSAERVEIVDYH